jgi:hypothetical protein
MKKNYEHAISKAIDAGVDFKAEASSPVFSSPTCDCGHANWQHAREGDARLESENYEIGQCYIAGCDCIEYNGQ